MKAAIDQAFDYFQALLDMQLRRDISRVLGHSNWQPEELRGRLQRTTQQGNPWETWTLDGKVLCYSASMFRPEVSPFEQIRPHDFEERNRRVDSLMKRMAVLRGPSDRVPRCGSKARDEYELLNNALGELLK